MRFIFALLLVPSVALALGQQTKSLPNPLSYEKQPSIVLRQHALLVTHVTSQWPGALRVQKKVDAIIEQFRLKKNPFVYLMASETWEKNWLTQNTNPTHVIYSAAGEHFLKLSNGELTFVGGYFKACLRNSVLSSTESLTEQASIKSLRMNFPMDAIFAGDQRTLLEQFESNYSREPQEFADYVLSFLRSAPELDHTTIDVILNQKHLIEINPNQNQKLQLNFYSP